MKDNKIISWFVFFIACVSAITLAITYPITVLIICIVYFMAKIEDILEKRKNKN
mgnify:CR=1 FL=1